MLIHVCFLGNHAHILLSAVMLVIIIKTILVALVIKGIGYNKKTEELLIYVINLVDKVALGHSIYLALVSPKFDKKKLYFI